MAFPLLTLVPLPQTLAVCRLDPRAEIPRWALSGDFYSITRTADELSLVCDEAAVPRGVAYEGGWRCFRVAGRLDFALTGVLAALAGPLAEAEVSLFALSTYDTDYLLVKDRLFDKAAAVLSSAGHTVLESD